MKYLILIISLLALAACERTSHLRGNAVNSKDGETYLSIIDDNGGGCPIFLDGKKWKYKLGERGLVKPGVHIIEACSEIEFSIPKGVIFTFDYWGP